MRGYRKNTKKEEGHYKVINKEQRRELWERKKGGKKTKKKYKRIRANSNYKAQRHKEKLHINQMVKESTFYEQNSEQERA